MLIGKNVEKVLNSDLYVDKWEVEHRDNFVTGDTDLVETYAGQVKMGKIVEQKCLGFILSSTGDNMANIQMLKKNSQIYLELGQAPARFDIFKLRLLFLKYILNQEQDSLIYKMFHLKLQNPSKGDWVSSCKENLQQLEIDFSFDEIKAMSVNKFKTLSVRN